MTKHSRFERDRRATETERVKEIERAWLASVPPAVMSAFSSAVKASREREPVVRVDMAPGTAPRPPRPGREPKPVKDDATARRRRS